MAFSGARCCLLYDNLSLAACGKRHYDESRPFLNADCWTLHVEARKPIGQAHYWCARAVHTNTAHAYEEVPFLTLKNSAGESSEVLIRRLTVLHRREKKEKQRENDHKSGSRISRSLSSPNPDRRYVIRLSGGKKTKNNQLRCLEPSKKCNEEAGKEIEKCEQRSTHRPPLVLLSFQRLRSQSEEKYAGQKSHHIAVSVSRLYVDHGNTSSLDVILNTILVVFE